VRGKKEHEEHPPLNTIPPSSITQSTHTKKLNKNQGLRMEEGKRKEGDDGEK
jgi:hypothetical protein